MLTNAQLASLRAYIDAATDPAIVSARTPATRADNVVANWLNDYGTADVWNDAVTGGALFEATNISKFDNLTAGKRSAWDLMLRFAPIDATRNKIRNGVVDIWGATDSVSILQDCRRKALRCEEAIGGSMVTTNTVSAIKLTRVGTVELDDVSAALNLVV